MATTQEYLNARGVSMQQALDFVLNYLNSPKTIFDTCSKFGVTTGMLADIVRPYVPNASSTLVTQFFSQFGLDASVLDKGTTGTMQTVVDVRAHANATTFDAGSGSFNFNIDLSAMQQGTGTSAGTSGEVNIANFGADDTITILHSDPMIRNAGASGYDQSINISTMSDLNYVGAGFSVETIHLIGQPSSNVNSILGNHGFSDFNSLPIGDIVLG